MDGIPIYRGVELFRLDGLPRAIELDEKGLHHPRSARSQVWIFTPYEDFTHLASSGRTLWLGTRRSTYMLPRHAFIDPNGPDNLVRALLARIAQAPNGSAQLARMAQIEETSRTRFPLRAVWGIAAVCLVVFLLQLTLDVPLREATYFSPVLVQDGDLWRLVTANLIHAAPWFPLHLIFNLLALLALGFLIERPLGTPRTICVMAASGLGAMWASGWIEGQPVVGASGIAFGLAGGALWLELRCADQLPAWWRLPRRLFYVLLAVNAAIPALLWALRIPLIAWGAHLGGFAAGLATTALLCGRQLPRRSPSPNWLRAAAAGVVVLTAFAFASAARSLAASDDFIASHATRLATLPGIHPEDLNEYAWLIAISPEHTPAQIQAALLLAERAVVETQRSRAHILDTLAEVQFQLGWHHQAVATIDEAIAQDPSEPYYQEQRKRFLGERDVEDRPSPLPWAPAPPPPEPSEPVSEPQLTV